MNNRLEGRMPPTTHNDVIRAAAKVSSKITASKTKNLSNKNKEWMSIAGTIIMLIERQNRPKRAKMDGLDDNGGKDAGAGRHSSSSSSSSSSSNISSDSNDSNSSGDENSHYGCGSWRGVGGIITINKDN